MTIHQIIGLHCVAGWHPELLDPKARVFQENFFRSAAKTVKRYVQHSPDLAHRLYLYGGQICDGKTEAGSAKQIMRLELERRGADVPITLQDGDEMTNMPAMLRNFLELTSGYAGRAIFITDTYRSEIAEQLIDCGRIRQPEASEVRVVGIKRWDCVPASELRRKYAAVARKLAALKGGHDPDPLQTLASMHASRR